MKRLSCLVLFSALLLCACGPKAGTEKPPSLPEVGISDSREAIQEEPPGGSEAIEVILPAQQDTTNMKNALVLPEVAGNKGETISIPLQVCGQVELCAFDLRISYDRNRLMYVGSENADDELIVHCKENEGILLINYLRISNLKEPHRFCDLQFKVLTKDVCTSELYVEVVEVVALEETGDILICETSAVNGVARLNGEGG